MDDDGWVINEWGNFRELSLSREQQGLGIGHNSWCHRQITSSLLFFYMFQSSYRRASKWTLGVSAVAATTFATLYSSHNKPIRSPLLLPTVYAEAIPPPNESNRSSHDNNNNKKVNELIGNLFRRSDIVRMMHVPSIPSMTAKLPSTEDINEKIAELYPSFTSQIEYIKQSYAYLWDFLSMEDFRHMMDEMEKEASDEKTYPEVAKDAHVR